MNFLGLDIALAKNGICLINENGDLIISDVFKTNNSDIIENRIKKLIDEILKIINENEIEKIYLEGLSYGSSGNSFAQICGMHYTLRYEILNNCNIDVTIIEPNKLKKFITGKGNCKKDLILLNVYKKFGVEFDDDNLADAYSLARMALEDYKIKKD